MRKSSPRRFWTEEERDIVRRLYPNTATKVIADKINRTESAVYSCAEMLGLAKDAEYLIKKQKECGMMVQSSGAKHQFPKGHTPFNKGKKQSDYMAPDAIERTKTTRFSKGNTPKNHRPIGSQRVTKDGYTQVKTAEPGTWGYLQHIKWVEKNGPIPEGMILACKSADKKNCDPDNWELISRVQSMKRNTYHNYPKEIARTIQLLGAVKRQINKRIKNSI